MPLVPFDSPPVSMHIFERLVLLSLFVLVSFGRAAQPAPKGWVVLGAPVEPSLASVSTEQLIDLLQDAEPDFRPSQNRNMFWPIGGVPRLGRDVAFRSGAAVELVRRGVTALPALLQHLNDGRHTKMIYAVRGLRPNSDYGAAYSDEYDPRNPAHIPVGVNTKLRRPLNEDDTYTFKVGDICYTAVGQIVGRELKAVRSSADEADAFSGVFSANPGDRFVSINSPVAQVALAEAVRSDWAGLSAEQHLQLLRDQVDAPVKRHSLNEPGLARLLFYFPNAGAEITEHLLHRKLGSGQTNAGEPKPGDEAVTFWWQAMLVRQLTPFRWNGLHTALLDVVHEAGRIADEELKKLPAGMWEPSIQGLGSDLALQCARLLVHQGDDEELKAFFTRRGELIEASLKAPATPGTNQGTLRLVNSIQAQECRKFVAELNGGKPAELPSARSDRVQPAAHGNVQLGQVTLKKEGSGVGLHLALVDPPMEDVLLGRVVITGAQDDVGVTLLQGYAPNLAPVSVGMTSERDLVGPPVPSLVASLTSAAPRAKTLRTLQGWVEVVVPKRDPNATVSIVNLASRFGVSLDQPALQEVGISITIYDRTSLSRANGAAPQNGPIFGEQAIRATGNALQLPELQPGDVALSMTDPNHRFLDVEFRGPDGGPLRYNHNGWYHADSAGTRFDVYRLGPTLPPGAVAVIWLLTDKSLLVAPLDLRNVPLPQ